MKVLTRHYRRVVSLQASLATSTHGRRSNDVWNNKNRRANAQRFHASHLNHCIWVVMLVTKHKLPESERDRSFVVTHPVGKKRSFDKLMDFAQWAAANALGKPESEWLMNGSDVE
jgi:hypothetical protein